MTAMTSDYALIRGGAGRLTRVCWTLLALPALAVASPVDEIALIHRAFLLCGPAVLGVQVSCTEATYRQNRTAGPELALFEEIVSEPVQYVLMGAIASAKASVSINEDLSDVERLLRGGTTLEVIRANFAKINAKLAQTRKQAEQAQRECLQRATSATGGSGGPTAAMSLCTVPVH